MVNVPNCGAPAWADCSGPSHIDSVGLVGSSPRPWLLHMVMIPLTRGVAPHWCRAFKCKAHTLDWVCITWKSATPVRLRHALMVLQNKDNKVWHRVCKWDLRWDSSYSCKRNSSSLITSLGLTLLTPESGRLGLLPREQMQWWEPEGDPV